MRVLFLNPIGHIGGAERVLLTAITALKRECPNAQVRLIALGDGPLLAAASTLGVEVEVIALPPGSAAVGDSFLRGTGLVRSVVGLPTLWSFVGVLRRAITRFAPDLVHSNGIKAHLLTRLAVPAGIPVVWHVHDFYGLRPVAGWLLRRARSRVKVAIAISQAVAADVRVMLPGVRVEVVPNTVDLERFSPAPGDGTQLDHLASLSLAPAGVVRVGLVATFARWKGHLTLLDAAARLLREFPTLPIRWYIVGGPIYHTAAQFTESELKQEVAARGLVGHVGFVPFAADPVPIYRALDVVVHASSQPEPFGLVVIEGMSCCRAVVVAAAGGAAELFTPGYDAIGFTPGNAGQLAEAVRRLVQSVELRARLGTAARQTAERHFDAKQYGPRLLAVYQSLLGTCRRM